MRFELPWPPAGGPKSPDLQIVVKYKGADGRVLEAQTQITVQLTGRRPKQTAAAGSSVSAAGPVGASGAPAAVPGEFSALKRPAESVSTEAPQPPASLPRREATVPRHDVSDARPGTEVP